MVVVAFRGDDNNDDVDDKAGGHKKKNQTRFLEVPPSRRIVFELEVVSVGVTEGSCEEGQ